MRLIKSELYLHSLIRKIQHPPYSYLIQWAYWELPLNQQALHRYHNLKVVGGCEGPRFLLFHARLKVVSEQLQEDNPRGTLGLSNTDQTSLHDSQIHTQDICKSECKSILCTATPFRDLVSAKESHTITGRYWAGNDGESACYHTCIAPQL